MEKEKILREQLALCLPLIEEERQVFIEAEHGRLRAVMGKEYWDPKTREEAVFYGGPEEDMELEYEIIRDPYDITLEDLARLPELEKKVERMGTYSYLAFFNLYPQDKKRLSLLAGMHKKLTHGRICADSEIEELKKGHDVYIGDKAEPQVRVIL